jgi:hypothetical protein
LYSVNTKTAFPLRAPFFILVSNMERTSLNTVTTAYTFLLINNYSLTLMTYRIGWTYFLTAGLGTVHTGMSPEEPLIGSLPKLHPYPIMR